ncbi:winged helix-turn-helix transcriptional regulator [Paenarthrobacter sp. Z7-10]|uniref:MarR family winged helix-turn-helix transcriptional regulator n=1 Tax=Paenarthrobacter sp. Z7-10 TaxID=2787635 RepID=UPI0022A9D80B|nr:MarR family winged helix-turn-helix transcriptional regulator [Paenarthrobacter sp. Z7-10]MCZ2404803.1 winged helix-turn-helix transcriptional regulator [Paenarthrobacter sp. Z7-10]
MDYEQAYALNRALRTIGMRHRLLAATELNRLGLSIGQESLIMELAKQGPRTQAQLATAAGCEPPTITSAVQKLEALGLVSRHPSTEDRRATVVELTTEGEALLEGLSAAWIHLAESTVAGLSRTRVEDLIEALADLAASLETASRDLDPRRLT